MNGNLTVRMTSWFLGLSILLFGMAPAFGRGTISFKLQSDLRQLDGAVEAFQSENNRLPSQAEGLAPVAMYLKGSTLPLDPWGNPYAYRVPGYYRTNLYEVYSTGADGVSKTRGGDVDDINLWDPKGRWAKHYGTEFLRKKPIAIGRRTSVWMILALSGSGLALAWGLPVLLGKFLKSAQKSRIDPNVSISR